MLISIEACEYEIVGKLSSGVIPSSCDKCSTPFFALYNINANIKITWYISDEMFSLFLTFASFLYGWVKIRLLFDKSKIKYQINFDVNINVDNVGNRVVA